MTRCDLDGHAFAPLTGSREALCPRCGTSITIGALPPASAPARRPRKRGAEPEPEQPTLPELETALARMMLDQQRGNGHMPAPVFDEEEEPRHVAVDSDDSLGTGTGV